MQMIEEYPKEFPDRFYPQMNKSQKTRLISKNGKDKKKKLANDIEFTEIVTGLFDLLNEMNKYSKNTARKNKRHLKTPRFELPVSESFEKIHKKQKLNPEKDLEELSEDRHHLIKNFHAHDENDWQTKALMNKSIGQRPLLESTFEKDENKKDLKKPGLYRFKDEVEGDQEFQLKRLNLLFKKEDKNNERPENFLDPSQNQSLSKPNFSEESNNQQQIMGRLIAEILKKIPNFSFEPNGSAHYSNTLNILNELVENKNYLFPTNMMNFNKSNALTFNMPVSNANNPRMNHEKIIENIEDIKYMNQKNLATPFKRAGTHVAIAYYIYVNKNKSKFNENKNTNECDPTYHARILRERKNPANSPSTENPQPNLGETHNQTENLPKEEEAQEILKQNLGEYEKTDAEKSKEKIEIEPIPPPEETKIEEEEKKELKIEPISIEQKKEEILIDEIDETEEKKEEQKQEGKQSEKKSECEEKNEKEDKKQESPGEINENSIAFSLNQGTESSKEITVETFSFRIFNVQGL